MQPRIPPALAIRGKHECRDEAADRDRRLTDAQRKTALARAEPLHDRPAARRVDARARRTGQRNEHEKLPKAGRERGCSEEDRTARKPDAHDGTLAEPVGSEPPRQEGQRRPDPLGLREAIPISPSESSYSVRSVGTSTGSPMTNAAVLALAVVPAARTAQR